MVDTANHGRREAVALDTSIPIWDRFFTVAPLVLIGTREADGRDDLAPKHMAGPLGWQNRFGFICTPRHATYQNVRRDARFTVSFPKPAQWLETSLSAAPRDEDACKPALAHLALRRSEHLGYPVLAESQVTLECRLDRIVDGFGANSLIAGEVTAAWVDPDSLRSEERDDQELIHLAPLLGYLSPGRFAVIDTSLTFPVPDGMQR